jgi:hypothetical protein
MEEASMQDLSRASKQGTILTIKVNGKTFGSGGFPSTAPESGKVVIFVFALGLVFGGMVWVGRHFFQRRWRTLQSAALQETFQIQSEDAVVA